MPGGFGTFYIVSALVNATVSTVNGKMSRQQQAELNQKSRELQEKMEQNRQNFQLEINERNTEAQRQLSIQNHELRLSEQQANFERMCQQTEWNRFMNTWPLLNVPGVIRAEQILPDHTVSLRVIFAKCNDQIFAKYVYPQVEQGLRDFVDLYHNEFGSRNIIFYQNGFSAGVSGGAMEANIHYALKELPVIIIDTNVLLDEICVSFTMWGLGSSERSHFTVFRIPYQMKAANGKIDVGYYMQMSDRILAYLKFILGYAYDAYNLIQYDRPPLLPYVAQRELGQEARGCLLKEPEVCQAIGQKYGEMYSMVIGEAKPGADEAGSYARLPESFKGSILHRLRADYAKSLHEYITPQTYVKYLDESLEAWAGLRSEEPAEAFLESIIQKRRKAGDFFGADDKEYFERLADLYEKAEDGSKYAEAVRLIGDILKTEELPEAVAEALPTIPPAVKKKRQFNL